MVTMAKHAMKVGSTTLTQALIKRTTVCMTKMGNNQVRISAKEQMRSNIFISFLMVINISFAHVLSVQRLRWDRNTMRPLGGSVNAIALSDIVVCTAGNCWKIKQI